MTVTFTDDRQALLNAIIAAPDDDAPRLIFADWLEEHGEAILAGFVRKDAANPVERNLVPKSYFKNKMLFTHEDALNAAYGPDFDDGSYITKKGLVEAVSCTMASWIKYGPEIVCKHPVRHVALYDCVPLNEDFTRRFWSEIEPGQDCTGSYNSDIHHGLFAFLKKRNRGRWKIDKYRFYNSMDDARADLSQACIAWAKSVIPS